MEWQEGIEDVVVVLCTVPDMETAGRIGRELVDKQLAACVNVIPGIRSIYAWQGKLCDESELLMVVKTRRATAVCWRNRSPAFIPTKTRKSLHFRSLQDGQSIWIGFVTGWGLDDVSEQGYGCWTIPRSQNMQVRMGRGSSGRGIGAGGERHWTWRSAIGLDCFGPRVGLRGYRRDLGRRWVATARGRNAQRVGNRLGTCWPAECITAGRPTGRLRALSGRVVVFDNEKGSARRNGRKGSEGKERSGCCGRISRKSQREAA